MCIYPIRNTNRNNTKQNVRFDLKSKQTNRFNPIPLLRPEAAASERREQIELEQLKLKQRELDLQAMSDSE